MRNQRNHIIAILLMLLLFCGCQTDPPTEDPTATTTEPSQLTTEASADTTAPAIQGQGLKTEPLEIVSWDHRRIADTSFQRFAESETGYYRRYSGFLYYADKADPGTWVPLCTKPNCEHQNGDYNYQGGAKKEQCDAELPMQYIRKGDRLYYTSTGDRFEGSGVVDIVLASMALDGTDKRIELYYEDWEETIQAGGGGFACDLTMDHFWMLGMHLNQEGMYYGTLYVTDEEGTYVAYEEEFEQRTYLEGPTNVFDYIYGDACYYMPTDPENLFSKIWRIKDRELYATEVDGLVLQRHYISDNTLLMFKPDQGYYSVDLTTREEAFLEGAQLTDSVAFIMQPNCIFETNMIQERKLEAGETRQLRFFDGQQWYDVALPPELQQAEGTPECWPQAVASDRIFLMIVDRENDSDSVEYIRLYQILLGTDTPTLEYVGLIGK